MSAHKAVPSYNSFLFIVELFLVNYNPYYSI